MTIGNREAEPIARLRDARGRTIGWVYLWNSAQISILWIDEDYAAERIDPRFDLEILASAKAVTIDALTNFLESLSTGGLNSP